MKIKGVVSWNGSKARATEAVIVPKLETASEAETPLVTDAHGRFESDTLADGKWTLKVYHREGRQPKPLTVELKKSEDAVVDIGLNSFRWTINQPVGYVFFGVLLAILLFSLHKAYTYWNDTVSEGFASDYLKGAVALQAAIEPLPTVHENKNLSDRLHKLSEQLSNRYSENQIEVVRTNKEQLALMQLLVGDSSDRWHRVLGAAAELPGLGKSLQSQVTELAQASEAEDYAHDPEVIDTMADALEGANNERFGALIRTMSQAEADDQAAAMLFKNHLSDQMKQLQTQIIRLARYEYQTQEKNKTLLSWIFEKNLSFNILFWAFIGSLVRLLMIIQGYVRFGRFYVEGIVQHIALLVCIPIITFVFVKLAGYIKLSTPGSAIKIDVSDPMLSSLLAFVLALSPWALWEKLLGISDGLSLPKEDRDKNANDSSDK